MITSFGFGSITVAVDVLCGVEDSPKQKDFFYFVFLKMTEDD